MTHLTRLDHWARGWRGPLLAALLALLAGSSGALLLPTLDRDEARFAQATAQMLETGDFVDIRLQDQPRDKKPVGIHWMQAASVALTSSAPARGIWAYRLPSLLGAMLAAGACAWGAAAFFGAGRGLIAGAILGGSFLLSTEAGIAKTDAVLCGTTTLALAALARLYARSRAFSGEADTGSPSENALAHWFIARFVRSGRFDRIEKGSRSGARASEAAGASVGWRIPLLFWFAIAIALLDKGPIGPMVVALTGLALWICDRRAPWASRLHWVWGLILVLAVVGPWAVAITVKTDGAFWGQAIGSDVAPKLRGGQEGHGQIFGYHAILASLLIFPATFLLPAALVEGWKARAEPGVRFALCWLIPGWLVFEVTPTKLPHYTLPLYGALAWLAVAALGRPLGLWSRRVGAALSLLAGVVWAAAPVYLAARYGDGVAMGWAVAAAILAMLAGFGGAVSLLSGRQGLMALAAIGGFGLTAHAAVVGGLGPRLQPLWLSRAVAGLLARNHLDPREGLVSGPVTVIGYAEPSLVFALGTETELGDAGDGGEAIAEGRPVVVETRAQAAFLAELASDNLKATAVGQVSGFDYSDGKRDTLTLYRSDSPPPAEPAPPSSSVPPTPPLSRKADVPLHSHR